MGDGGSTVLGLVLASISIKGAVDGMWPVAVPLALFMPFWADATYTLIRRTMARHNPLRPHRDHLYQVAIRAGSSHKRIAIAYWLAMIHCALAAAVSLAFPIEGSTIAFFVSVLLFGYLAFHGRKFASAHGHDTP